MKKRFSFALFLATACSLLGQAPVLTLALNGLGQPRLAPGDIAVLYGTLPADAARNFTATVGNQATLVSGVLINRNVTINIRIQIPNEAPLGATTIVLTHLGVASNALPVNITAVDPLLPTDPYFSFQHNNSGVYVTPSAPASPGEPVTIFATGLGTTTPLFATGATVTSFAPTDLPVNVSVAGQNIAPDFAGHYPLAPQFNEANYQVSFTLPQNVQPGPQPVIVTIGGVASNTQTIFVGPQILTGQPAITGITNGASFSTSTSIPGGSFVSIFGTGFGTQDNLTAFPSTMVNGISVLFNGVPAPIFSLIASRGQINVLVPTEVPPSDNVTVVVVNQNGPSKASAIVSGAAAPGIFLVSDPSNTARHNAAALLANTAWLVVPASQAKALGITACNGLAVTSLCGQPARPGDFVQLYVTGLGKATPNGDPNAAPLATGQVAPLSGSPLYITVASPTITVGGQTAKLIFSGLAPGYSGLYQVDFQIPSNVAVGDNVAVQIAMPNGATDSAVLAVSQ